MSDVLFHTENFTFSYRVAGICIQNGKVLLQKPTNDDGYAFPGGHVKLGETTEETLRREFQEEIGTGIAVKELQWVAEIFIPWKGKTIHQICLYYRVDLAEENIPTEGSFWGTEELEGRNFRIGFHWIPLEQVADLPVYPTNAVELLPKLNQGVQHFIYRED